MPPFYRQAARFFKHYQFLLLLFGSLSSTAQTIRYVSTTGTNANPATATSWATSTTDLQGAINASAANDQVWVKAGLYKPGGAANTSRTISFAMKNVVAIYGGFTGTETALSQRPAINLTAPSGTTLSGEIGDPNSTTDNSLHVIANSSGLTNSAIIDGFVITAGNANGETSTYPNSAGGGMLNEGNFNGQFCNPTVRNCAFVNNKASIGAAVHISGYFSGNANPTFLNCQFVGNEASFSGGAMYNDGFAGNSSPVLTNCLFQNNRASAGGAIRTDSRASGNSSPVLTNCTFLSNTATSSGGGAFHNEGDGATTGPRLINCVVWDNGGAATITNNAASMTATYNLFEPSVTGYVSGPGNLTTTVSPFINSGSIQLLPTAPAINAGDPATTSATVGTTDLAGNARFLDSRVDMGAVEFQCQTANRLYVRAGATGANTGLSWADAFTNLQSALTYPACSGTLSEIWVAAGTYKPTSTTVRTLSFSMLSGVALYGGFPNTGNPTLNERNPALNPTILSGDIDGVADVVSGSGSSLTINGNGGNSLHVVNNRNVTGARLDGFTVSGGHANLGTGTDLNLRGGGLLNMVEGVGQTSSLTINNCLFTGNQVTSDGGGIYNVGSTNTMQLSSCTLVANVSLTGSGGGLYNLNTGGSGQLTNCLVSGNKAGNFGGGLLTAVSLTVTQCVITDNFSSNVGGMVHTNTPLLMTQTVIRNNATVFQGSGIQIRDTPGALLTNCEISGNSSQNSQGGLLHSTAFFASSSLTLVNCTVANNTSRGQFRAVWTTTSSTTQTARTFLKNTIVANNVNGNFLQDTPSALLQSVGYNLDSDGSSSFTNGANGDIVGLNPGFVSNSDVRLQACSPAVNAGDPVSTSATVGLTDLAGQARLFGGRVDMGAYELQQAPSTSGLPTRLYVRAGATGANTGLSWADAFPDLQVALSYPCSQSLTEIWVAGGLYKPTSSTARGISFRMLHNVAMYGGFLGTETALNQRPAINLTTPSSTTLSGEIGNLASTTDNSLHIVNNLPGLTSSAVLDGFVITGGNADGAFPDNAGGGMLNQSSINTLGCSPLIRNGLFINNTATFGAAVFNDGSFGGSSSPVLTNCSFQGNRVTSNGGAMYNYGFRGVSSPVLTNCSFQSNTAISGGGAMFNDVNQGSSPVLTNASFDSNSANFGGAMFSRGSSVLTNVSFSRNRATTDGGATYYDGNATTRSVLTNVSFTQNTAGFGGDIRSFGANASLTLTNGVVFTNGIANGFAITGGSSLLVQYSLLDSSIPGSAYTSGPGNLTTATSPFVSTTSLQLAASSPAINAGDPATTSATVGLTDLAGNPRFINTIVDMGAYEFQQILEVFSLRDGLWNEATLWSVGRLPLAGERVRLKHAVTMPTNFTGLSGTLIYNPNSRLIYEPGGRLQTGQ